MSSQSFQPQAAHNGIALRIPDMRKLLTLVTGQEVLDMLHSVPSGMDTAFASSSKFLLPNESRKTRSSKLVVPNTPREIPNLTNLPHEIIVITCTHLEPLWLLNLSHVCRSTYKHLSGDLGNQVWYNSLPPETWNEPERYQDEAELKQKELLLGISQGL
jgi:hypothetical protein